MVSHLESLETICLQRLTRMLADVATELEFALDVDGWCHDGGDGDSTATVDVVRARVGSIRDYLFTNLPLRLAEMAADARINKRLYGGGCANCQAPHIIKNLRWSQLRAALYLHPWLTRLEVASSETYPSLFKRAAQENDTFWNQELAKLTNLTYLDLSQLGTDSVLALVGQHMPKLAHIKFEPKIKVDQRGQYERTCLTDQGMLALTNCSALQTIRVGNGGVTDKLGDKAMDPAVMSRLVMGLPRLENINLDFMGRVIEAAASAVAGGGKTSRPTNLRVFRERDPSHTSVDDIKTFCPKVIKLALGSGYEHRDVTVTRSPRTDAQKRSHRHLHALLDDLAVCSTVKVRELIVCDMSVSDMEVDKTYDDDDDRPAAGGAAGASLDHTGGGGGGVLTFLRLKGAHLHTLRVDYHPIHRGFPDLLDAVVEGCPELRHLTVAHHRAIEQAGTGRLPTGVNVLKAGEWRRPVLRRLRFLAFHCRMDNAKDVLPALLADAVDIETIDYRITDCADNHLDHANLTELQRRNPLISLRYLSILKSQLTPEMFLAFADRCPRLESVRYCQPHPARQRWQYGASSHVNDIISARFPHCRWPIDLTAADLE